MEKVFLVFGCLNKKLVLVLLGVAFFATASTPSFATFHKCVQCEAQGEVLSSCGGCMATRYCGAKCQKDAWPKHKGFCKTASALKEGVELKESTIPGAGLGLFAKKDFATGESVAVYFGEVLTRTVANSEKVLSSYSLKNFHDQFVIGRSSHDTPAHLGGQFANDPFMDSESLALLSSLDCRVINKENLEKIATNYVRNLLKKRDLIALEADARSEFPILKARRPIKRGEELFFSYGLSQWLDRATLICDRKGQLLNSFRMMGIASQAVEKLLGEVQARIVLKSFVTQEEMQKNIKLFGHPKFETALRISGLFAIPQVLQIQARDPKQFSSMVEELHILDQLEDISWVSNEEFGDPAEGIRIHPKSRVLLRSMLQWRAEHLGESSSPVGAFSVNDVEHGGEVAEGVLEQLISP